MGCGSNTRLYTCSWRSFVIGEGQTEAGRDAKRRDAAQNYPKIGDGNLSKIIRDSVLLEGWPQYGRMTAVEFLNNLTLR